MNIFWLKSFFSVLLVATALPTWAADSKNIASVTAFQGVEAHQRLIDEAKKEGSLVMYTAISGPVSQRLQTKFEEKYGIKVKLWRAGSRKVVQRVTAESKTNIAGVDVINIGTLEMEMLHREKLLQPVESSFASELIPGSMAPHKEWVSTFVDVVAQAYNTDKVKKSELPKTYQDLLDPKWKGRLGVVGPGEEEWFYAIVNSMGQEKGLKYFRDLVETNGLSVRDGHSSLNNLIVAGEVPLGIGAFVHMADASKKKGAPIDYVLLDPTIAVSYSMGIAAKPIHPHAALLFYEYMLTDGQKVFADMHYFPTRKDIETPLKNIKYEMVDKGVFLDVFDKWRDLWDEIIIKKSKRE